MDKLASIFKEAREAKAISVEEVSSDLETSKETIINLENGNEKSFKDKLELREFLKTYARYLGIDEKEVINLYNDFLFCHTSRISLKDIGDRKREIENKVSSPYINPVKVEMEEEKFNTKIILIVFLVFLFLLFIILIKLFLISKNEENMEVGYGNKGQQITEQIIIY